MKKLILSLAMIAAGTAAFAQKPVAGDKTAEVNFTGFGLNSFNYGTNAGNLAIPELRFRHFMSDKMALRARIGLGSTSNTVKETQNVGGSDLALEAKIGNGFGISLSPGIEFHLPGTDKLSPYYGAQLGFGFNTGTSLDVTNASNYNAGLGFTGVASGNKRSETGGSQMAINLGLFMGADYYITNSIFVGGEFGLGLFNMTSTGEGETAVNGGAAVKTGTASSFDLFGVTAGNVRLGFKF